MAREIYWEEIKENFFLLRDAKAPQGDGYISCILQAIKGSVGRDFIQAIQQH